MHLSLCTYQFKFNKKFTDSVLTVKLKTVKIIKIFPRQNFALHGTYKLSNQVSLAFKNICAAVLATIFIPGDSYYYSSIFCISLSSGNLPT